VILIISRRVHQRDNHEYAKGRAIMEETSRSNYQPDCPLAHDLINKLAVIVGQCDLLVEKTPKDSPLLKQTLLVRDLAKAVGSELGQLQCDLARLRTTNGLDSKTSVV
jgi:hypothetical protein